MSSKINFKLDMRTPDFGYIYQIDMPETIYIAPFDCFIIKANIIKEILAPANGIWCIVKSNLILNYMNNKNFEIIAAFKKDEVIEIFT